MLALEGIKILDFRHHKQVHKLFKYFCPIFNRSQTALIQFHGFINMPRHIFTKSQIGLH